MPTNTQFIPGLEGVVAAQTRKSLVDGQAGKLVIGGFPIEEIAMRASYEEMVYLLWHERLPSEKELVSFTQELSSMRELPAATLALLREVAPHKPDMMDVLRAAAGTLGLSSGKDATNDKI